MNKTDCLLHLKEYFPSAYEEYIKEGKKVLPFIKKDMEAAFGHCSREEYSKEDFDKDIAVVEYLYNIQE